MVMEFLLNENGYKYVSDFNSGKRPYAFFKEQKTGTIILYIHGSREGLFGIGDMLCEPKMFIEGAFERLNKLYKTVLDSKRPLGIISCHCGAITPFEVNGVQVIPISDTKEEISTFVGETIGDGYILEIFIK